MNLTLGEAQDIFIDMVPGLEIGQVACTPATDAEPTYIESWQCTDPNLFVIWYDGPGLPVCIEIETDNPLRDVIYRDIVDAEDIESVVARLTQN